MSELRLLSHRPIDWLYEIETRDYDPVAEFRNKAFGEDTLPPRPDLLVITPWQMYAYKMTLGIHVCYEMLKSGGFCFDGIPIESRAS